MTTENIRLDRMVITDEVFRTVQDGGCISVQQSDNGQTHVALYDSDGVFVDWLS